MTVALDLPGTLERELREEFARRGIDQWSVGVVGLLEEAVRASRVPGIAFADSMSGRQAVLAGTGLGVWEIIATWKACSEPPGKRAVSRRAFCRTRMSG